jgi:hypothetical protein
MLALERAHTPGCRGVARLIKLPVRYPPNDDNSICIPCQESSLTGISFTKCACGDSSIMSDERIGIIVGIVDTKIPNPNGPVKTSASDHFFVGRDAHSGYVTRRTK